jgi:hypothetical protein
MDVLRDILAFLWGIVLILLVINGQWSQQPLKFFVFLAILIIYLVYRLNSQKEV